jgi:hypothetical protein
MIQSQDSKRLIQEPVGAQNNDGVHNTVKFFKKDQFEFSEWEELLGVFWDLI